MKSVQSFRDSFLLIAILFLVTSLSAMNKPNKDNANTTGFAFKQIVGEYARHSDSGIIKALRRRESLKNLAVRRSAQKAIMLSRSGSVLPENEDDVVMLGSGAEHVEK